MVTVELVRSVDNPAAVLRAEDDVLLLEVLIEIIVLDVDAALKFLRLERLLLSCRDGEVAGRLSGPRHNDVLFARHMVRNRRHFK